ncbi:LysR family transcriptional regulator [Parasedimentitalea psychrophila]|uniref:LysR family transcriptional regulator n=1 Tax=Parasedimentitalea psychrophila TaxID=2997337 RepID=A0A9Y2P5H0_9RHOB|nr:LysR family transcriptional regulator [Parasedimentitalea psychrophila]WIY23580.1 LysR family transcriptional regulator [Parasedimentitalea psychrophila]
MMSSDPQWDDMKVFLAVAREASLSGAGRILNMDPATVGRRVARFEIALDTQLFVKSPQGYALSSAGDRLLVHAEEAEQAMRAAKETLNGPSETLSGQIRIGAPDGSANYLLPQVCAQIAEDNPDLDIQIVALPRVINLGRREADMAVTVSAPTAGQLLVQKISDYKLHMVASRHYLKQHPKIQTLDDLKAHKMIGYIPDMIFDRELDYLRDIGIERVALASNSVSVQLKMAAQGTALCVAHDFTLPFYRPLRKVLADKISLTRSFYLVRHQADQRSERLNRFAEALSKGIRDEVVRLEGLT